MSGDSRTNTGTSIRAVLSAIAGFAVVLLMIWGVNHQIVQPAFVELERVQALEDSTRARAAIQGELRQLDQKLGDWAAWDDAYAFAEDRNPAFVHSNLGDWRVLEKSTHVNLCLILDRQGQRLYAGGYDSDLGGLGPRRRPPPGRVRRRSAGDRHPAPRRTGTGTGARRPPADRVRGTAARGPSHPDHSGKGTSARRPALRPVSRRTVAVGAG